MAGVSFLILKLQPRRREQRTDSWEVLSARDGSLLGLVSFKAEWRRYVFQSYLGPVFDPLCLRELADFMEGQTEARRREQRQTRT